MQYRDFGNTGLKVSAIGFGAWPIGGGFVLSGRGMGYGPTDDEESKSALHKAIDLGVNFIDTANSYGAGKSEELIGQVLAERSEEVYVATKVGVVRRDPEWPTFLYTPEHIFEEVEKSLKRLKRDRIDIYQLHNPKPDIVEQGEAITALEKLQQQGKIRFFGVSIGDPEEGKTAIAKGAQSLQLAYNLVNRTAENQLFDQAKKAGTALIIREPLANGMLAGNYTKDTVFPPDDWRSAWLKGENLAKAVDTVDSLKQLVGGRIRSMAELALRFVLSQDAVSVAIPGAKNSAQVESNCRAASGEILSAEERRQLDEVFPPGSSAWKAWGR